MKNMITTIITTIIATIITCLIKIISKKKKELGCLTTLDRKIMDDDNRLKFYRRKKIYVDLKHLDSLIIFMDENNIIVKEVRDDFRANILHFAADGHLFYAKKRNRTAIILSLACYIIAPMWLLFTLHEIQLLNAVLPPIAPYTVALSILFIAIVGYFLIIFIPSKWLNCYLTIKKRRNEGYL